ncbi:MAG: hypothetical protein M1818_007262 [Claussenomyces sp. TS43310]|nr:MAG: hypothetical protein M1818_007262 [Claussenomyces sp. TS43310]
MLRGLRRTPIPRQDAHSASELNETISPIQIQMNGNDVEVGKTGIASGAEIDEFELNEALIYFEQNHRWDPNLPSSYTEAVTAALKAHDIEAEISLEHGLAEQSPYPEVQAAVRNYDEDLACNTIRAWVIGLLLTTVGSALNMLLSMRQPSIAITSIVAQVLAYPIGIGWTKVMPSMVFTTLGIRWSLNPGPFNMKEHTIITVMANASFGNGAAYATDVLLAQYLFYGQNFGWGFQLLLTWTTTMMGFGLAGLARPFLVWPAAMIWPTNLVNTTLFYSLHDHSRADPFRTGGWSIGRYRYFLYVGLASFTWYWFPGFIFQALSVFAFVTWIRPKNVIINQLFGGFTGLSLLPISFDWTVVTGYVLSPLIPPWHAIANTMIGCVIFFWFTSMGLHYSGVWSSEYLPMSTSGCFDNTGKPYDVKKVVGPDLKLDVAKYEAYSPLFLSTTFALTYGLSFATMISLLVHTALYNGREIYQRYKLAREQEDDVHMRLMKKYRDVPNLWYLILFFVTAGASLAVCYAWNTYLSGWAFVVCLLIPVVWSIPIGMVQAVTNVAIGLNVITEFIVGYMQPGKPLAMMMFKSYGYMTMFQGLAFVQDLKLGHYMKVPPRTMFFTQLVATFWSGIVQIAVMNWALGAIPNVCASDQAHNFTCPQGRVFFTASVIWGLLGPQRIFSPGQVYKALYWFFLPGALLPVILWLLASKFPKSPFRYVMAPLIFGGTGWIPPATPINYLAWGMVGWFFNRYIRGKHLGWWMHYNYITSAGLDVGLVLSTIVIFLTITLTNTNAPTWWGNNVVSSTLDAQSAAVQKIVPEGQTFGPPAGSWH